MSLQLGWPSVKYPESSSDESQILEGVRSAIASKRDASSPVAAIVIEPTNYQSGYVASENFMQELARIARESDAALIVDEQATCCGATCYNMLHAACYMLEAAVIHAACYMLEAAVLHAACCGATC